MKEITTLQELTDTIGANKGLCYFSAPWCAPCKMVAPIMEELFNEGTPVVKVNVDDAPELAAKYGVRSVPTIVLLDKSTEQKRVIGTRSKEQYKREFGLGD